MNKNEVKITTAETVELMASIATTIGEETQMVPARSKKQTNT
jgi:hypothetical protein